MLPQNHENMDTINMTQYRKKHTDLFTRIVYIYFLLYIMFNFVISVALPNDCVNYKIIFFGALSSIYTDVLIRMITNFYIRRRYIIISDA